MIVELVLSAIVALQSVGHTPLQHEGEMEINESEGNFH